MIKVKKIDGTDILINAEHIDFVERRGDTVVSLTTGNKIVVQNSLDEIKEKVIEYKKSIQSKENRAIDQ